MTAWRIRLSRPLISEPTIQRVIDVLRSPDLSLGPALRSFEQAFAAKHGVGEAVAVSSGTAGLHLAVRLLGLGPSDEAVTTPFSFIASANCLLFEGARPVFADIDPDSFTLDLAAAEAAVTPRTRALIPVHVFGNAVDMERVAEIAGRRGLSVIEDACEAVGGLFRGRALGAWGDFGVFGFYPNKPITTGEGGVVISRDPTALPRLRSLRNQGRSATGDGSFDDLGYNYRLSDVAAAIGEGQVADLDGLLARRRARQRIYRELLGGIDQLRVPPFRDDRSPFVFIVQARTHMLRERIHTDLNSNGIQSAVYFRPIHLEPLYRRRFGFQEGQFPVTEHAGKTCLAIPFHSSITEGEQVEVATVIRAAVTRHVQESASTQRERSTVASAGHGR